MVARLLRWAADQIDPPKPPRYPEYPLRASGSVFHGAPDLDAQRRDDALGLMDQETLGYVLVTARDRGYDTKLSVQTALADELWPAMRSALARVVVEAERVYR